jgi:hypothetical protein
MLVQKLQSNGAKYGDVSAKTKAGRTLTQKSNFLQNKNRTVTSIAEDL